MKSFKFLHGMCIFTVYLINMGIFINIGYPLSDAALHLFQMRHFCTKDDIFSISILHVLFKDCANAHRSVHALSDPLNERKAAVLFIGVLYPHDSLLIMQDLVFIKIHRCDIFWRWQNSKCNGFCKIHFGCYISVKQLHRHIPLFVKISDACRRQAHKLCIRITCYQFTNALFPFFCTASVKFI